LGFGGAEAAESPGVFEEMVDEFAFGSVGRLPAVGELFGEGAELVGVFAGDDDGGGVDAGLEGIEADGFFALVGRGSGGPLRISRLASICLMVAIVAGLLPDSIVAGECKGIWGFWEGGIENKGDSGRDCVSMGFWGGFFHRRDAKDTEEDAEKRPLKRRDAGLHFFLMKRVPNAVVLVANLRIDAEVSRQKVCLYEFHDVGVVLTAFDTPAHIG